MMDGSMVLTKEDDWKEVKLARIFSEQDRLQLLPIQRIPWDLRDRR